MAPPPTPTMTSVRVKPVWPSAFQQYAATSAVLASSAFGTWMAIGLVALPGQVLAQRLTGLGERLGVQHGDPLGPVPMSPASSPSSCRPTSTSYGVGARRAADLDTRSLPRSASCCPSAPVRRGPLGRPLRGCGPSVATTARGDLGVQGAAGVHQLAPLLARVDGEQRAGGVEADAPDGLLDVHRQVDDGRPASSARVSASRIAPPPRARTPSCSASAVAHGLLARARGSAARPRRRRSRRSRGPRSATMSSSVSR